MCSYGLSCICSLSFEGTAVQMLACYTQAWSNGVALPLDLQTTNDLCCTMHLLFAEACHTTPLPLTQCVLAALSTSNAYVYCCGALRSLAVSCCGLALTCHSMASV